MLSFVPSKVFVGSRDGFRGSGPAWVKWKNMAATVWTLSLFVSFLSFLFFYYSPCSFSISLLSFSACENNCLILFCRPNGAVFAVETTSSHAAAREGDVVTFTYVRTAQQAIPSSILRIRKDVTWREVVQNWHENIPLSERQGNHFKALLTQLLPRLSLCLSLSLSPYSLSNKNIGLNMLIDDSENASEPEVSSFFENFSKSKNFDPRIAENWYSALPALAKHKVI